MTVQLAPTPVFKAFDANGAPLFGGQLSSYQAGTLIPQATWVDSTQTTQNTNPVILNSRGEASIWCDPTLTYKLLLQDSSGNQIWVVDNVVGGYLTYALLAALLTQSYIGQILYPRTAAEISVNVTPVNYFRPPGTVTRYGTNTLPGSTDMTSAVQAALNQAGQVSGVPAYLPAGTYLVTSQLLASSNSRFYGDGSSSIINFSSVLNADSLVATGVSDFSISNMKLVVTGAQTGANYVGVVAFRGSTNCVCTNIEFTGVINCGTVLAGSNYCRISSNYFHSFTSSAFTDSSDIRMEATATNNCQYNVIDGNQCFGGNANGIGCDTSPSSGLLLLNSNVYSNNRTGRHTQYGILLYTHIAGDTYDQVVNNYVENIQGTALSGQSGTGIYIAGMGAVNVADNIIVNCCVGSTTTFTQGGITLNTDITGSPCNVTGNSIYDMAQGNSNACQIAGIALYNCGLGTLVASNVVSQQQAGGGTTYIGIYVPAGNGGNVTLSGNNVNILNSLTTTRGIFLFANGALANVGITGNSITGCSFSGIGVQQTGGNTATNLVITGNTVVEGGASSIPFDLTNAANIAFSGNVGVAGASASTCLELNAVTGFMGAGNILSTGATNVVVTANTCTGSLLGETNLLNGKVVNSGSGINVYTTGTQAPTSGTWAVGDHVRNTAPTSSTTPGWYCTTAGTPGTWTAEPNL